MLNSNARRVAGNARPGGKKVLVFNLEILRLKKTVGKYKEELDKSKRQLRIISLFEKNNAVLFTIT